jgi:magnesium chelatase subunit H
LYTPADSSHVTALGHAYTLHYYHTGDWQDGDELGNTWQSRNTFSYGRGGERGTARPELLQSLLQSTERIVQEIDSVEYGLTDIQEYFANTGM